MTLNWKPDNCSSPSCYVELTYDESLLEHYLAGKIDADQIVYTLTNVFNVCSFHQGIPQENLLTELFTDNHFMGQVNKSIQETLASLPDTTTPDTPTTPTTPDNPDTNPQPVSPKIYKVYYDDQRKLHVILKNFPPNEEQAIRDSLLAYDVIYDG